MNKKILTLFAGCCLAFASCDNFLDIQPKGIVIPKTCEDYETLLNDAQLMKASESYPIYLTDDIFMLDDDDMTGGFNYMELPNQRLYTFQSEVFGDGETDGLWTYSYNRIYTYNVIINNVLGSSNATEEHKKQVQAEALVGRAFEYLTLVNAYGKHYDAETAQTDPGVPLLLDEDINKTNLTRATVQQVYDQIKVDLDQASLNLPERPVLNANRASRPVGYGMLARMYLYMGDYEQALENARLSLENNSTLLDMKQYNVVDPEQYFGRTDLPQDPSDNPENIYVRRMPYVYGVNSSVYGSDDLINLYDHENDKRYLLYFTKRLGTTTTDYDLYAPYVALNIAMGTPEIYLIAAECEARIGSKDQAMEYINTLRDYRIVNNTPISADSNEEALRLVLEERRRELTMNGCMRLIDLKRLNKEPEFAKIITHRANGVDYTLEPNSPKYVLPIPPTVLRYNPDMEDNPR